MGKLTSLPVMRRLREISFPITGAEFYAYRDMRIPLRAT
jgi:hypothetical protein